MRTSDSILIIGHPKSGKTTFLAQFYTRVGKGKSSIVLSKAPENIKAITDAVGRLASGEEPITTPAGDNVELVLPINIDGTNVDLVCPDYGGEQVNNLTQFMEFDTNWRRLVDSSDRWILFIRPFEIAPEYDLSVSSYEVMQIIRGTIFKSPGLSAQSRFIELLQILLYTKNKGARCRIFSPRLSIVLTCWDEMNTTETPAHVLQDKLPLLYHFVKTVWDHEALKILGLSAQEFPLNSQVAKDKYLDELPENLGYMLNQEGVRDKDITRIVKMALQ